jgi:NTE family protein
MQQSNQMTYFNRTKGVGLVLSGGGARGMAHIGILKALHQFHIFPSVISANSMGAIIGALYASGMSPDDMEKTAIQQQIFFMFRLAWKRNAVLHLDRVRTFLKENIKTTTFESLGMPLFVSVSNMSEARVEYMHKGDFVDPVLASCAIPLLFEPIPIHSCLYADGALFDNLPILPLEGLCSQVIAADVNPLSVRHDFNHFWEVTDRVMSIAVQGHALRAKQKANVFISPSPLSEYSFWEFHKAEEMIRCGEKFTLDWLRNHKEIVDKLQQLS